MDKQIINGIKYEKLTQDQLHDLSQWELVDIILAYRKDLKAKEQECEELKKQACCLRLELKYIIDKSCCKYNINAKNYHEKIVEIIKNLDQLKRNNEELKKQLMQKSEVDMFFNTPIKGWSNDPCGICRYKQTLAEIKDITKKCIKTNNSTYNPSIQVTARAILSEEILQKINECEVDNEV